MPPDEPIPGSPADWLRFARADLALSRVPLPAGSLYSLLCFHAQLAAEKSLKAILIHQQIEPPRTHDLGVLLDSLPPMVDPPPEIAEAVDLTRFAVVTRYPGLAAPVSEADYREAIAGAEAVLTWAESIISTTPGQSRP